MDCAGSGIRGDAEATCTENRTDVRPDLGGDTGDDGLAIVGARSKSDAVLGLRRNARDNRLAVISAGNRTGIRSDPERDVGDDGLAVIDAGNRIGAGSALGRDVRDDGLVVVDDELAIRDDGLAARDDRSATDDDGLVAKIDKKMDVDDRLDTRASNQLNGNRSDVDLIITITGDIKADLIKDLNNGVLVVVSAKLSRIVPDKHAMNSPIRILADIINNLFGDLL